MLINVQKEKAAILMIGYYNLGRKAAQAYIYMYKEKEES